MRSLIICLLCIMLVASGSKSIAQACPITSLGQNPSTAFPVCGTNTFIQQSVNLCGGTTVPNPKCNTNLLSDVNPYWYKFTCFEAGTLGFTIQPNSNVSDYDWQVFDITGKNADNVYVDKSLTIASNWSQYYGNTGTSPSAANVLECEGPTPQLSKMPTLIKGHEYLLLVSHFSNTQAGYKLIFSGGTASITDTTTPHLKSLYASCDGKTLGVKLNKKFRCSSVAANGSDFYLVNNAAVITGASAPGCTNGFDFDSVILNIDQPLPAGTYTLRVKNGSDGNTLLDYCDNAIALTDSLTITVLPAQPTPMDSILPVACSPTSFNLVFKTDILCSSIAANGSDFVVTGPSPVTVTSATASCNNGLTKNILVNFSSPIQLGGLYTITLKTGTDGNTLINECTKETPAGAFLINRCYDTVSAGINYIISSSCIDDTLKLSNAGRVSINSWTWDFGDGISSTQATQRVFSSGTKTISLKVTNGVCRDSASVTISFDKTRVKAAFDAPLFVCPLDTAFFVNNSTGPVTSYNWDFGTGITSTLKDPPYQFFPAALTLQQFRVKLEVMAANGCSDTALKTIVVPGNCYIAVPSAFTPNGDGKNDFLYPLNAYKATNLDFKVYNRYGQLVWQTTDWTKKWDGRINGELQAAGVYAWHLFYIDEKRKVIDLKGTTTLIR